MRTRITAHHRRRDHQRDPSDQALTNLWRDFVFTRRQTPQFYWTTGGHANRWRIPVDVVADLPFDEDNIEAARVLTDALLESSDPERIKIGHELRKFVAFMVKRGSFYLRTPADKQRFRTIARKFSQHIGTVYGSGDTWTRAQRRGEGPQSPQGDPPNRVHAATKSRRDADRLTLLRLWDDVLRIHHRQLRGPAYRTEQNPQGAIAAARVVHPSKANMEAAYVLGDALMERRNPRARQLGEKLAWFMEIFEDWSPDSVTPYSNRMRRYQVLDPSEWADFGALIRDITELLAA